MAAAAASSSSSSAAAKPIIGILSIGDMGMGIAKLLIAHDYPVLTVAKGRSQHTKDRIKAAHIKEVEADEVLVIECDIILSIVPPRDAWATAKRIHDASKDVADARQDRKGFANLLYIDMNAVSSRTVKKIHQMLCPPGAATSSPSIVRRLSKTLSMKSTDGHPSAIPISIRFLDGGILGGPPQLQSDKTWKKPSVVLSGQDSKMLLTEQLESVLNIKVISDQIGSASTLKACFATFSKGIYALTVASYTTAHTAGILPELQGYVGDFFPTIKEFIDKGVPSMPPKAYRWVDEMKQIGETFADEGHLGQSFGGQAMFDGVSDIYKTITNETVLGKELVHKRNRGTTVEDVAEAVKEGLAEKRMKADADPKLELAWRSSWGV